MHMVVQGGRGTSHGVRDGEDDGYAGRLQHRWRRRPGKKLYLPPNRNETAIIPKYLIKEREGQNTIS